MQVFQVRAKLRMSIWFENVKISISSTKRDNVPSKLQSISNDQSYGANPLSQYQSVHWQRRLCYINRLFFRIPRTIVQRPSRRLLDHLSFCAKSCAVQREGLPVSTAGSLAGVQVLDPKRSGLHDQHGSLQAGTELEEAPRFH